MPEIPLVSADTRCSVVHYLESEEHYHFRVAGSNILGMGEFTETDEAVLSHQTGVPSPPTKPVITTWTGDTVTVNTTLIKFGSKVNLSLSCVLLLNGTEIARFVGIELPQDYKLNQEVELLLTNVSYRGDLRFAVFATNYLGPSLLSELSLTGQFVMLEGLVRSGNNLHVHGGLIGC